MADKINFCYHLKQKEDKIFGVDPIYHSCKIKDLMGFGVDVCVASQWTEEDGKEFYQYNEGCAKRCPLFTTKRGLAEKTEEIIQLLKLEGSGY